MVGHIDERWVKAHSHWPDGTASTAPEVLAPRIPDYWMWLVIVFGAIAVIPAQPYPGKVTGRPQYVLVATAYSRPDLFDDWPTTLLLHSLAALLVAIPAAACLSRWGTAIAPIS